MSRHLTLIALALVPGLVLSACDAPSTLSKAKPGECYSVVGRDSLGAPKLAKTACAGSPAALAAACPKPAPATAPEAACPTAGAGKAAAKVAAGGHRASAGVARTRKTARRTSANQYARYVSSDDRVAKSGEVTSLGIEYARVGEELAGGPTYQAGGYERRESYARHDYAPPPPPPVLRREGGSSLQYSERSRRSGSYSESYSSSSYGSGGYGRGGCDCDAGGRGQPPHSPFDGYGYLTWRGKTPG